MTAHVALVTDSAACLPEGELVEHGIRSVSLHVIGDGVQRDETELLGLPEADLVGWLRGLRKVVTSRPSPAAILEAYEEAAAAGATSIVSVHLSAELSGTVEAATLAGARASVPVEVVDSRVAGMAQGFSVLSAARAAARGATTAQVAAAALARADDATVRFYVDTLEHLRRGGRIGAAAHLFGSALAIKPLLGIEDGIVRPVAKVRTAAKALDRLVTEATAAVADTPFGADVSVQQLGAAERADDIRGRLERACPDALVRCDRLGPVIGAHVGPGTVAVVVSPRPAPTSLAR